MRVQVRVRHRSNLGAVADPYELLGLSPQASLDDAEEAYHHRLLRCHPDLHASEGREAVARAEAQTRELNNAIDRIRHGWRPSPASNSGPAPRSGSGFGAGPSTRRASGSRFAGRTREEPWPAGADKGRDHRPVPCPFCGQPVASLSDFEDHLAQAHPAQDRGRRKAARRHARAERWWWPVPLWLFATIDAALVGLSILVVAAMGGHSTVVQNVLGDDAPRPCVRGEFVRDRWGGHTCNPDTWPWTYVVGGVMLFVAFAVYRWTTARRD
jgi:hypothetical protein